MDARAVQGQRRSNTALLGGHIDVVADSTGWGELVNAGKFRLLVTWGAARTRNWPSVPTLRESGIGHGVQFAVRPRRPGRDRDPAIVKTLHDAFKKGMEEPSYVATQVTLDQEAFYLNSEDYRKFAMQQIEEQRELVKDLGLKAN